VVSRIVAQCITSQRRCPMSRLTPALQRIRSQRFQRLVLLVARGSSQEIQDAAAAIAELSYPADAGAWIAFAKARLNASRPRSA
jgi:hypothetical protein